MEKMTRQEIEDLLDSVFRDLSVGRTLLAEITSQTAIAYSILYLADVILEVCNERQRHHAERD